MAKVYTFRVLLDHESDCFRDIEISSSHTFEDFHKIILKCFGFDNKNLASFFMSNEDWEQGQEIMLSTENNRDISGPIATMKNCRLAGFINNPEQKIIYVYDYNLMWCFYIELLKKGEPEKGVEYPRCVLEHGEAPNQYDKEPPEYDVDDLDLPDNNSVKDYTYNLMDDEEDEDTESSVAAAMEEVELEDEEEEEDSEMEEELKQSED